MSVKRYDKITLDRSKAIMLDNGMMKVPARIARVGVQKYCRADGTIENVLRAPEEVFAVDSISSFDLVPLTNDHPYAEGGAVTAENAKRLQVGTVGNPHQAGPFVEAMMMITDAATVAAVKSGKVELSCGYFCDRQPMRGVYKDANGVNHPYEFVQKNIRGNHVAVVDQGRAGPEVRIQLDSDTAFEIDVIQPGDSPSKKGSDSMEKLSVDGLDYEVSSNFVKAFEKHEKLSSEALSAKDAEIKSLKAELDKKAAVCDSATAEVAKLKAELAAAPEKLKAEATARVALEASAAKLAPEFKCDGLDTMAVKRGVLNKLGDVKCDGKSDEYVNAAFDIALVNQEKKNPATEAVAAAAKDQKPVADASNLTPRQKAEREFFAGPKQ
jgi:hypothetical protein